VVGDFDTVVGAWKENGGATLQFDAGFLAASARASVRTELADEAMDYADHGVAAPGVLVAAMGELPELRDAMSLVWRILLVWMAVLALFVVAGWVG
jgi:AmpE protein